MHSSLLEWQWKDIMFHAYEVEPIVNVGVFFVKAFSLLIISWKTPMLYANHDEHDG